MWWAATLVLPIIFSGCAGNGTGAPSATTTPGQPTLLTESGVPTNASPPTAEATPKAIAVAACTALTPAGTPTNGFDTALAAAAPLAAKAADADRAFGPLDAHVRALVAAPIPVATAPQSEKNTYFSLYLPVVEICSDLGVQLPSD